MLGLGQQVADPLRELSDRLRKSLRIEPIPFMQGRAAQYVHGGLPLGDGSSDLWRFGVRQKADVRFCPRYRRCARFPG